MPQKQHQVNWPHRCRKSRKQFAKRLEASVSKRLFRGVLGGCLPGEKSQLSNGSKTLTRRIHVTGMFTYLWWIFVVSVGVGTSKYSIHGSFDIPLYSLVDRDPHYNPYIAGSDFIPCINYISRGRLGHCSLVLNRHLTYHRVCGATSETDVFQTFLAGSVCVCVYNGISIYRWFFWDLGTGMQNTYKVFSVKGIL